MAKSIMYTGPMFAGKSSKLVEKISDYDHYNLFKPNMDDRYEKGEVVCHTGVSLKCQSVPADDIYKEVLENDYNELEAVGIDEAQFFGESIVDVVHYAEENDVDLVFAGLNLDFKKEVFGYMDELIDMSDEVYYLTADCDFEGCDADALYTQRLLDDEPASYDSPVVVVGADDVYEARCEEHHKVRYPDDVTNK